MVRENCERKRGIGQGGGEVAKIGRDGVREIFEHCCYRWMFNNCQSEYTSQMRTQHFFSHGPFFIASTATAAVVVVDFFYLTCFTSQSFEITAHRERESKSIYRLYKSVPQ